LLLAVLADIWIRQQGIVQEWMRRFRQARTKEATNG